MTHNLGFRVLAKVVRVLFLQYCRHSFFCDFFLVSRHLLHVSSPKKCMLFLRASALYKPMQTLDGNLQKILSLSVCVWREPNENIACTLTPISWSLLGYVLILLLIAVWKCYCKQDCRTNSTCVAVSRTCTCSRVSKEVFVCLKSPWIFI